MPLYLLVLKLIRGAQMVSLPKKMELIQDMELESLLEFMNFTKCLIKDYS